MIAIGVMLAFLPLAGAARADGTELSPPPAKVAALPSGALQQAESDPDLIAARAAISTDNGRSVKRADGAAATALYLKAINRGNVIAMVELADRQNLPNGSWILLDIRNAQALYQRAALLGYAVASKRLAELYAQGDGVAKDETRAAAWYGLAADLGDDGANAWMAMHYLEADTEATENARALHYAEQGVAHDGALSRTLLAEMYRQGWGVAKDEAKAFHMMLLAAEQGQPQAQVLLGYMYREGIGIQKDPYQAEHWYKRARETKVTQDDVTILIP